MTDLRRWVGLEEDGFDCLHGLKMGRIKIAIVTYPKPMVLCVVYLRVGSFESFFPEDDAPR